MKFILFALLVGFSINSQALVNSYLVVISQEDTVIIANTEDSAKILNVATGRVCFVGSAEALAKAINDKIFVDSDWGLAQSKVAIPNTLIFEYYDVGTEKTVTAQRCQ